MIVKGFHYAVTCDTEKCDKGFIIGTVRHNFEARRRAKQEVVKRGWVPGPSGTVECNVCRQKREVANLIIAKDEIEADSPGFKPIQHTISPDPQVEIMEPEGIIEGVKEVGV